MADENIDPLRVTTRQGMGTTSVEVDGKDVGWFSRKGAFYTATHSKDKKEFVCFSADEATNKIVQQEAKRKSA